MKAWILHDIGDLRLEMVEKPEVKADDVLVQVKAAGICGSDIPRIYRTGAYSYPLIPGHEFSGVVSSLGSEVDTKWLNRRVGIYPLIPCKQCIPCNNGQYEMCRHYSYLGSRRDGGFAEYVTVPVGNLIELPDSVSYEEAAMLEPMAVAVHAIRRITPVFSDKIVVCGLGTIGMFILMFLLEAGMENVFAIGNKISQKQTAMRLGLKEDCYCDSNIEDIEQWILTRTGGNGADVFFECVGKNKTLTWGVLGAAPAGKLMLVGNPLSNMTLDKQVYWKILRNQLTVNGTWNSSFKDEGDDWHYVLERLNHKKIAPSELISHRYSMEELMQGFFIMRNKTENYIKIMMKV